MRAKSGSQRREILLFPPSLEDVIQENAIVRLIDAFVNSLDLESHGFEVKHKKSHLAGAPQYAPSDLLKIYLYGYINRTRSSRQLQRCCKINIEMIWLLNGLSPGHVTIANFRKNNATGLKEVFRSYNNFLLEQDLFGKKSIAVDSAQFSAQNSRRNNFNDRSLERMQKHIDQKSEEYLKLLDQTDQDDCLEISTDEIKVKLQHLELRKESCQRLKAQLARAKEGGDKQISTVDSDAKLLIKGRDKGQVCYNIQSTVDDKNCLIIHNEVTNVGDQNALYSNASMAKEELKVTHIDVLADSGYDTGEELKKCVQDGGITTYVSPRTQVVNNKNQKFGKCNFIFDLESDSYLCPQGHKLISNGRWYTKLRKGKKDARFKEYKLDYQTCNACAFKLECAGKRLNRKQSRVIERGEYADYTEANQKRIMHNKNYYRRRQAIVEHPFGTIKRQWGYTYTLLKGKEKVAGEFDLICLCYNIRRSVSLIGVKSLIFKLRTKKSA